MSDLERLVLSACIVAAVATGVHRSLPPPSPITAHDTSTLLPESVIHGARGSPLALSGDGRLCCHTETGNVLIVREVAPHRTTVRISLPFPPDELAFNASADFVAATDAGGNVAIIDVPCAAVAFAHSFDAGLDYVGWSGWKRDALVLHSAGDAFACFVRRQTLVESPSLSSWKLVPVRTGLRMVATLAGTETVFGLEDDGRFTLWSVGGLAEDLPVFLPPRAHPPSNLLIGWKSEGVCYIAEGVKILEYAPTIGLRAYQVAAPVSSIAWLTETEHVIVSTGDEGRSRVFLGDSQRPGWTRDLDLANEQAASLALLDDRRHLVIITRTGNARIYNLRP